MYHKISDEEFLNRVHSILLQNLSKEYDLQVKLEEYFGRSYSLIKQRYKRNLRITILTKYEEMRLKYAKEHLMTERCYNVMIDLGFRYESYFAKWFCKYTGMNPSEYRKINSISKNDRQNVLLKSIG
jgi:methylphosphotriester-DNA--protein-cysteine methyltransferase